MTIRDRLDAYVARGLDVTLTADRQLSVRGPSWLRDLARPSLLQHRDAIVAYLADLA